jgi:hypothetical protein
MVEVLRMIDSDAASLARRLDAALRELGDGHIADTFTHWYTTRPPVHEAVVLRPPGA